MGVVGGIFSDIEGIFTVSLVLNLDLVYHPFLRGRLFRSIAACGPHVVILQNAHLELQCGDDLVIP